MTALLHKTYGLSSDHLLVAEPRAQRIVTRSMTRHMASAVSQLMALGRILPGSSPLSLQTPSEAFRVKESG